jgi:hypothetical protein
LELRDVDVVGKDIAGLAFCVTDDPAGDVDVKEGVVLALANGFVRQRVFVRHIGQVTLLAVDRLGRDDEVENGAMQCL